GLDPLDLPAVQTGLPLGHFQSRPVTVHPRNLGTSGQVKGEAALIAEHIERLTACVLGGGCIVLSLVQKCSSLLPFQSLVMKLNSIHAEYRAALFTHNQCRAAGWKLLKLPDLGLNTFHDCGWTQSVFQFRDEGCAYVLGIHRLRQHLKREQIVVAIHNQPRKKVGLTKDQAICVAVGNYPLTICERGTNPLAK